MRIALITGASSGMGEVFARYIDRDEKDIDEIWLIARRKEKLEEIAASLEHPARAVPLDLCAEGSMDALGAMLDEENARVGILVNCAGFAKIGDYGNVSLLDSGRIIDLNCKAAVSVTLVCIPHMKAGDRIMELCSTASFLPLSRLNIYASSKAFMLSYSRALRMELLHEGIVVTAVCPWWVGDTEFIKVARDNDANTAVRQDIKHFLAPQKKEDVVRRALRASRRGKAVSTPGVISTIVRIFYRLVPTTTELYLWELLRRA